MTPRDLMAVFEVVAEAPGGVGRLRELVLQLAVRGRLVAQEDGDELAGVLLGRRAIELSDPAPIELPRGWAWTNLARLGEVRGGGTPSKQRESYWCGDVPWVSPKDMKRDYIDDAQDHVSDAAIVGSSARRIPAGSLLMVVRGMILAHSFPVALTLREVTVNQDMKAVLPFDSRIAPWLLLSNKGRRVQVLSLVERSTHGTCKLPTEELLNLPLPMPPLAEQHRIVTRVDELMTLLDRLESARNAREATRVALRDAALAALRDAAGPEDVEVAWTRISEHLDELFVVPEDVAPFRQAVLELAVRGRLVRQDPGDEPAGVLLGRRAIELSAPGPIELPRGWAWTNLARLGEVRGGGTPSKQRESYWCGDVPWVSPKDMKRDYIEDAQDHVSDAAIDGSSARRIPAGSLLMVVRGMILAHSFPVALTLREVTVNQDMKAVLPFDSRIAPWLLLSNKGQRVQVLSLVERSTHGTCKLPTAELFCLPMAMPPLAEQHRIVARVDQLMELLDQLEEHLADNTAAHAALAAAAVHNLEP